MPLKVSQGSAEHSMDQFYVKVPLKLKHYFEVADDITENEKNFTYIEDIALELIQIYGHPDMEKMPPTTATTFEDISILSWNQKDVQNKFEQALSTNIPMLRYLNSENFHRYEYPVTDLSGIYQRTYDNMIIPLTGGEDLEVNFDYFGWETYLDVNEGTGKIQPNDFFIKSPLPLIPFSFSLQKYYNTYDVSFPVMVSLRDPIAFGGEGYSFVFALEANIQNNYPATEADDIPKSITDRKETMLCDEDKYNSDLIKTVVVDSFSKEPVELVKIGFTVPEQDTCVMGTTNYDGELNTNYPAVYGGVVEVIKTDYLTSYYPVDTYDYKELPGILGYAVAGYPENVMEIHKFKEVNVSVKKNDFSKCIKPSLCSYTYSPISLTVIPYKDISCKTGEEICFFNSGGSLMPLEFNEPLLNITANNSMSLNHYYYLTSAKKSLSDKEKVIINLDRVRDTNPSVISDAFSTSFSINGEETTSVILVPGVYSMSATVVYEDKLTIPTDSRCTTFNVLGWEEDSCFDISGMEVNQYVTGLTEFNTPSTYITITPDQLYNANEIEFNVLNYDMSNIPQSFIGKAKECASYGCIGGVGCIYEACEDQDIEINALVIEDMTLVGEMENISKITEVRAGLEPIYK